MVESFLRNSSLITWDKTSMCKAICTIKSLKRDLDYVLSFNKTLEGIHKDSNQELIRNRNYSGIHKTFQIFLMDLMQYLVHRMKAASCSNELPCSQELQEQ